jgi:proteasome lid subunit RPN8/RPN11
MDSALKISETLKKQLVDFARQSPHAEVGGFIVETKDGLEFAPMKNEAPPDVKDKVCIVGGMQYIQCLKRGKITAFFHTHPATDETASDFDKLSCEHFNIPFLIYSTKTGKFNTIYP